MQGKIFLSVQPGVNFLGCAFSRGKWESIQGQKRREWREAVMDFREILYKQIEELGRVEGILDVVEWMFMRGDFSVSKNLWKFKRHKLWPW